MRYSDFQLAVRNLRGSDLTESGLDEISITDLAQKESELIEHLILNQPESRAVKVRLLHEIDECLKDFYFFVSHAKRELDRAREIGKGGTTRRQRNAWQRVRDIISGVEGGLDTYLAMLKTYFPEEMERYDTGTSEDIISHFSKHIFKPKGALPIQGAPQAEVSAPTAKAAPATSAGSRLDSNLRPFGFFTLPKVAALSIENQQKLVGLICQNKLPYQIAMLSELGFIEYLLDEHYTSKKAFYREFAPLLTPLGKDKTGRGIKGNLSTLSEKTTEDLLRYTAYQYKQQVKNDYEGLK